MSNLETIISCIENGEAEKGLEQLSEFVQKASDDEKFYVANYYMQLGFMEEAGGLIDELAVKYPEEGQINILRAEIFLELDEEEKAMEVLHEISSDDDVYVQALVLQADIYQMQGLDEVAEQKLLQAKELLPDEAIITFGLAEFYLSREDFFKSTMYYRSLMEEHKEMNGISIALRLAESLSGIGEWQEAIEHYEEGLQGTKEIYAMFQYATTLIKAELYARAISVLTELKEMDPHFTGIYILLAKAYEQEEMLQESYDTLQEGLKTDEYNIDLYIAAAKVAVKQKKVVEAEKMLGEALSLEPSHVEGTLMLSHLYINEEKYEETIELLEDTQKRGEHDPQFEWDFATAKRHLEMYEEAYKHYEEAYTSFKNDVNFLEEYGYFLIEEGQRERAMQLFARALKIDATLVHLEEIIQDLSGE
jgi:tetratricopeptide (TPR) repeat protein